MAYDHLRLIGKALSFFIPYLFTFIGQRIQAIAHRYTYAATPNAKNVVILGGSFAGIELANRLADSLPTGFKVVLVEKHSHFHYSFVFPRFSVLPDREHLAFIPYTGLARHSPAGIFTRLQATATALTATHVVLDTGETVSYAYLVIATGSSQPLPAQVQATERSTACAQLREVQAAIRESRSIAVVGAGAVGVELASDIKDYNPEKEVTLVHSRDRVLNSFGKRLHEYVLSALEALGVRVLLGERPALQEKGTGKDATLVFGDGRSETFDLVIRCTGQVPNSGILAPLLPDAICPETSRILVSPTLQVKAASSSTNGPAILALGDVAEHGGPRMARAAFIQAQIVCDNILALVHGRRPEQVYRPKPDFEGAIQLTLGRKHRVVYTMDEDGSDLLIPSKNGEEDLGIAKAWKLYGARLE